MKNFQAHGRKQSAPRVDEVLAREGSDRVPLHTS